MKLPFHSTDSVVVSIILTVRFKSFISVRHSS